MSLPSVQPRSFREMTDDEFAASLRNIITTSDTEDQVRDRLRTELGYPYTIAITSLRLTDEVSRSASEIVRALGGVHLRSGAMVSVMAYGPSGKVINL